MDQQKAIIIGAGFTGLAAALALATNGWRVQIIERDGAPPGDEPDAAFAGWVRRGVAQMRHSHVFLARLTNLLRDFYPGLLAEMSAAGCRILEFRDGLPPGLLNGYTPAPEDEDLKFVSGRRVTLELVLRRHVAAMPNVEIIQDSRVRGLLFDARATMCCVTGVETESGTEERVFLADLVIDASGRGTRSLAWLEQAGIAIEEETAPAGIIYFTRHYRLRPGMQEPPRTEHPTVGDLFYLKFGVFRADNGWFSLTLAVPEIEVELGAAIRNPAMFDRVCALLPGVAPWTDAGRAEPMSQVFTMGGLRSHWRHFIRDGKPAALNYFVIGDGAVCSNPLYGRGCSAGFLQAHLLAEICVKSANPFERALLFETMMRREIRPFYDLMCKEDAQSIRRASAQRNGDYQPSLRARLMKRFLEDGIRPASRGDIKVMRALMRGFHMLENPSLALQDPDILWRISRYLLRGRKRNADLIGPPIGPERDMMLNNLGIQQDARDIKELSA
jgi:2-polyprenyl-6-methoxyphenol hydroxylase-like FAD-dependent oxidoreductase